jgi:hypothetical protein
MQTIPCDVKTVTLAFPNFALATSRLMQVMFKVTPPAHFMHFGLACLAAALEKDGHEVLVVDAVVENLNKDALANRIGKRNPSIIRASKQTSTD